MAYVFYLIGWIVIIVGLVIAGSAAAQITTVDLSAMFGGTSLINMAAITPVAATLAPGVSIMFSGLLILAIGGVLRRLDRIARNTRPARV